MCQVLVWFYSKLWICLVSSKNWRKLSVFYPLLQNVIGGSHWNSVWNLATFPVKQYKKPTALIRAIEVAFYTTKRFSSSSFHNKNPFKTCISAIGLTYQFSNFKFLQFSDIWNFVSKKWTLNPQKITLLESVRLMIPTIFAEQKLVGWAVQATLRPKQRKKPRFSKLRNWRKEVATRARLFPKIRVDSRRNVWAVQVSYWKSGNAFSTFITYLRVSEFRLRSRTILRLQNA